MPSHFSRFSSPSGNPVYVFVKCWKVISRFRNKYVHSQIFFEGCNFSLIFLAFTRCEWTFHIHLYWDNTLVTAKAILASMFVSTLRYEIAPIRTHGNLFINSKRRRFRPDINEPFSLKLVVYSLIYFAVASAFAWNEWGLERLSIPWYFSYSLLVTMLHTLVLFVQLVGDHATYLGTSRTVCWRPCRPWSTCWGDMTCTRSSSGCSTSSSHFRCTSGDLGPLSITETSSHCRVISRCLYSDQCEQTLTTVHNLRTYIHLPTQTSNCECNRYFF